MVLIVNRSTSGYMRRLRAVWWRFARYRNRSLVRPAIDADHSLAISGIDYTIVQGPGGGAIAMFATSTGRGPNVDEGREDRDHMIVDGLEYVIGDASAVGARVFYAVPTEVYEAAQAKQTAAGIRWSSQEGREPWPEGQ